MDSNGYNKPERPQQFVSKNKQKQKYKNQNESSKHFDEIAELIKENPEMYQMFLEKFEQDRRLEELKDLIFDNFLEDPDIISNQNANFLPNKQPVQVKHPIPNHLAQALVNQKIAEILIFNEDQKRKEEERKRKEAEYYKQRVNDFSYYSIINKKSEDDFEYNKNQFNFLWESSDVTLSDSIDIIQKEVLDPIKIILSEKEKSIALRQKNQLVIGRSGTGKTTTAVVKLTSMQKSFEKELIKRNPTMKEGLYGMVKLGKTVSGLINGETLKVCFTTISNFLTMDVYNFYRKVMGGVQNKQYEVNTLSEVTSWPHFTNIKELILQIDGNLAIPFVKRDRDGQIVILNTMDVNLDNRLFVETKTESDEYSEINIKIFQQNFWNTNKNRFEKMKIDPFITYSQINSYITGHQSSHKNDLNMIPLEKYLNLVGKTKTYLEVDQKKNIYSVCKEYQQWKRTNFYFDFNDIVNYIIKKIFEGQYNSDEGYFHYLFVDEVQDLNCATLYLLSLLTQQSIYLGGDTAQTINNENSFRFADLMAIFNLNKGEDRDLETNYVLNSEIQETQLTQNFRSHGSIIELNNTIVKLLEVFFPTSIDQLIPEISLKVGPKPIVITQRNHLYKFLSQDQEKGKQVDYFGRLQIYIVRDEAEKAKLKNTLESENKKGSIFTVLESKGLEFQDVIAYNLLSKTFSFTKCWNALSLLSVKDEKIQLEDFKKRFNCELKDEFQGSTFKRVKGNNFVTMKSIEKKANADTQILKEYSKEFNVLIAELKNIYVAFSRARSRIFIYEENTDFKNKRQNPIINLLDELMLLDSREITDDSIGTIMGDHIQYIKENEPLKNNREQFISLAQQLEERKNYESAAYYYEIVGEVVCQRICLAKLQIQKTDQYLEKQKEQFEKEKKQVIEGQGILKNQSVYSQVKAQYLEVVELLKDTNELALIAQLYNKLGMYSEAIQSYKKLIDFIKNQPEDKNNNKKIAEITSHIKQLYFKKAEILETNKQLEKEADQNYKELEEFLEGNSTVDGKVLLYISFRLNDIDKLFSNLVTFKNKNLIEEDDLINTLHYYYPKILDVKLKQILELKEENGRDQKLLTQAKLGGILKDLIAKLIVPFENEFIRIAKSRQNMEYFQSQLAIFKLVSNIGSIKQADDNENILNEKNLMMFYIMLIHFNCDDAIMKFNNILQVQQLAHLIYIQELYKYKSIEPKLSTTMEEISKNSWITSGKEGQKQIFFKDSLFYIYLGLWDLLKENKLILEDKEDEDQLKYNYFNNTLQIFGQQKKPTSLKVAIENDFDKLKFFQILVSYKKDSQLALEDVKNLSSLELGNTYKHTLQFILEHKSQRIEKLKNITESLIQVIKKQEITGKTNLDRLLMVQDLLYGFYKCLREIDVGELLKSEIVYSLMFIIDFIINFNSDQNDALLTGESNQIFIDAFCSCFGFISTSLPQDLQEDIDILKKKRYFWKLIGYNQYYLVSDDNPIFQNKIFKSENNISPLISTKYSNLKLIDKKTAILYSKKCLGEASAQFISKYSNFLKSRIGKREFYQYYDPESQIQFYLQSLYLNDSLKQLFSKINRQENILMQKIPKIHAREHEMETLKELIETSDENKKEFFKKEYNRKVESYTKQGFKYIKDAESVNIIDQSTYNTFKNHIIKNSLVISQYHKVNNMRQEYSKMDEFFVNEAVQILSNILVICENQKQESENLVQTKQPLSQQASENQKEEDQENSDEKTQEEQVQKLLDNLELQKLQSGEQQEQTLQKMESDSYFTQTNDEEYKMESELQNEEENLGEEKEVEKQDMLKYCDDILYIYTLLNMSNLQSVLSDMVPKLNGELYTFTKLCVEFFGARKNQNRMIISMKSIQILNQCRSNINDYSQLFILQIGLTEMLLLLTALNDSKENANQQGNYNQKQKGGSKNCQILVLQEFESFFSIKKNQQQQQIVHMTQFEEQIELAKLIQQLYKYFDDLFELIPTINFDRMNVPIKNMIIQILFLSLITYPQLLNKEKFRNKVSQFLDVIFQGINLKGYNEFYKFYQVRNFYERIENEIDGLQRQMKIRVFRCVFFKTFQTLLRNYNNISNDQYNIYTLLTSLKKDYIRCLLIQTVYNQVYSYPIQIQRVKQTQYDKDETIIEQEKQLKDKIKKQKEMLLRIQSEDEERQQREEHEEDDEECDSEEEDELEKVKKEQKQRELYSLYVSEFYKPDFLSYLNQHVFHNLVTYRCYNQNITNQIDAFQKSFLEVTILTQKVRKIFLEELNLSLGVNGKKSQKSKESQSLNSSENYIYIIQKLNKISSQELKFYNALSKEGSIIYDNPDFESELEQLSITFKNKMKKYYIDYLNYLAEPKEKIQHSVLNPMQFITEQINLKH